MEFWIKGGQLILSLSILIVLHEMGHFIPAKLFKTRVEKFYLFFDPWFSLFKLKKGDTEYGVGWLPLGGYVKISGMIDESMDKEQMESPAQPHEFRAKPAWQRLIIMLGGVTVNVILAVIIFASIVYIWGKEYLPVENMKYGVAVDSVGRAIGFQDGDKIIDVGGIEIEKFKDVQKEILLGDASYVTVKRNGNNVKVAIDDHVRKQMIDMSQQMILTPRIPFYVDKFAPYSDADDAGLKEGDRLVAVNGENARFFDQFKELVGQHKGEKVSVSAVRNGDTLSYNVSVSDKGLLGISPNVDLERFFGTETEKFGFFESMGVGLSDAFTKLYDYIRQFKLIFNKDVKGYEKIGGFGAIASVFPDYWNLQSFMSITGYLSLMLAFMNILPIPALDGGHAMFLIYEIVSGRKPSLKFMEYAQLVGMVILFSLLIFANGNDIFRYFTETN